MSNTFCPLPLVVALVVAGVLVSASSSAQSSGNSGGNSSSQPSIRQSAVFLEQIVGSWGLVLSKWDRDATPQQWLSARKSCEKTANTSSIERIADASEELPPTAILNGSVVFYRAAGGLQYYDVQSGQVRLYPKLRVGGTGTSPAYQINGNEGQGLSPRIIKIGRIKTDMDPAIVMVLDGALLLRCQQPEDDKTN